MSRIVYNACYGGFNISLECYLEMKRLGLAQDIVDSIEPRIDEWIKEHSLFHYYQDPYNDGEYSHYTALLGAWNKTYNKFYGWIEKTTKDPNADPHRLLEDCIKMYLEEAEKDHIEIEIFEINKEAVLQYPERFRSILWIYWQPQRHSKLLLQAIDNIGLEAASGPCSQLDISEIYSDMYKIEEYDGFERVEEIYQESGIHNISEPDKI